MYHYLEDREFESRMRQFGGKLMQAMCRHLKEDFDIGATASLIGSAGRNLITQNAAQPVDLDYNLLIQRCDDYEDCRYLKDCAQKAMNKALREIGTLSCADSTSVLTVRNIWLYGMVHPSFSIDVCIIYRDEDGQFYRLIHKKTGLASRDQYYWNCAPSAKDVRRKAKRIKGRGKWEMVREEYLRIKNMYLTRNDTANHPSYVCYAEAVNNVYHKLGNWS